LNLNRMKTTKFLRLALTAWLGLAATPSQASLFSQTFGGGAIPDGNPTGVSFTGTFTAADTGTDPVLGITVGLNVSGGYNGSLFCYLIAPNGTRITLMNEPGMGVNFFGATGAGMNLTLQDGASDHGNIQNETGGGILTGTYNAANSLGTFNNSSVNGDWTLFFEDTTSGGGSSMLNSWTLNITSVPEPTNIALGIFGLIVAARLAVKGLAGFRRRAMGIFSDVPPVRG
jgi:subtilisin-like proprotein convertase family protein